MNVNTKLPLYEALAEFLDVLKCPGSDRKPKIEHIKLLDSILAKDILNAELKATLREIRPVLQKPTISMENHDGYRLASRLEKWMIKNNMPRFIYHGTIFGNLKSIKESGLIPGFKKVWTERNVSREYCDKAVFFDDTWHKALNFWAFVASKSSRARRNSKNRLQAVIRIPSQGLDLKHDELANSRRSFMVESIVSLTDPYVIVGEVKGFPNWRPLDEILSES